MRSATVVEVEVAADRGAGLADAVVGAQIDLLVFDAAPQPLDEDVVPPGALAVHAHRNAIVGKYAGEAPPGNRGPWAGFKFAGFPLRSHGIPQRLDAERPPHGDRYA